MIKVDYSGYLQKKKLLSAYVFTIRFIKSASKSLGCIYVGCLEISLTDRVKKIYQSDPDITSF